MMALRFLGQRPAAELAKSSVTTLWEWATYNWKPEAVSLRVDIDLADMGSDAST
jgi:hypothetical protein